MDWRAIGLFVVAMATTVVSAQSNTTESPSIFGDLPEANYTTETVGNIDTGSLQALFNMATGFVNVVFKPFSELADLIKPIIDSPDAGAWLAANWNQVASFDAGYLACLVFGILFFIFVPIVGSCMCCCRCCGNCGGRLEQSTKRSKSCWRQCLCVTMLILTVLMAIPTVFVFLTNTWVTDVIDIGPNKIVAVLGDTSEYLKVVPKQINYVTKQYDTVDANVRPLVDLGTSVGIPFQKFVSDEAVASLTALDEAAKVQQDAINAIVVVNTSLAELETGMATLNVSLTTLQANMTDPANLGDLDCQGDKYCLAVYGSAGDLEVGFDVSSIAPLRDDLVSVNDDLSGYNISDLQDSVQKEIDDIPETVANNTADASQKAVEALDEAENSVGQVSSSLPTDSLEDIDKTIVNIQNQTTNAVTFYNDNYEYYRYVAGVVLGSLLAVIVGCYLLGILLGACGNDRKVSPSERGTASNCGGIWLMVGVGFSFIFSWILMLLVIVLFTVGGHGERYGCQGLDEPKYEALGLVEDIVGGFNLSSTLNLPPEANLTLAGLLNSCKDNQSVYSALNLEYVYNVTSYLGDVSQQMTTLEEELDSSVNAVDLDSLVIYTEGDQTDVLALTETNLNTINFTKYLEDLGSGVTKTNLTEYAQFLRASAGSFTTARTKFKVLVEDYADEVDRIQREEVADLQDDYTNLETSITQLVDISGSLNTTISQLDSSLTSLNATIQSDSTAVIQEITDDLYVQIEGNITAYTNWAGVQVTDKVGACRPVYDAYTVSVGLLCDYIIDTTNGLWFSLGWCLFFLLPAAIIAMKLMKFFRRMTFQETFEDSWGEMEMGDYPTSGNKANGGYY